MSDKITLQELFDSISNVSGTALKSQARTETESSDDIVNLGGRGIVVVLDVTDKTGSPSITLEIEGKDPASDEYYTILKSAAVTDVITTTYRVHPYLESTPNLVAKDILPKTLRVTVEHSNTDSITYSVGYSFTK